MKKLLLILLCMIALTGCQDNTSSPTKPSEKEETPIVEQKKETLDDVTFELDIPNWDWVTKEERKQYASNNSILIYTKYLGEDVDVLIDNETNKMYNLQTKELIEDESKILKGTVYNFMLVSSVCGGGKGLDYNTYIGGPVGSHKLSDIECRAEISQDLINQINSLQGFKVWGVSIPFNLGSATGGDDESNATNIVSIEIPARSNQFSSSEDYVKEETRLKKLLHSKFGLIQPTNFRPQGFSGNALNKSLCDKYNLKCEVVD